MRRRLVSLLSRLGLLSATRTARSTLRRLTPAARAKARRARERRRRLERLYGSLVSQGDLCFDVGANLGVRVELFRRLGARVVAVEPNPSCLDVLREKFAEDPGVTLIPKGLGAEPGEHEFFVSSDIQTSSMSKEWIDSVADRLADYSWGERRRVAVTTLDALIAEHGLPVFCKIDVEGFELEVLRGLSQAIPKLSFEYTPERLDPALACVDRLEELGSYVYALSEAEDFELGDPWTGGEEIKARLRTLRGSGRSGDVYARHL